MAKSLAQFSPQKLSLLQTSKAAFFQYLSDRKEPHHNYQRRSMFWDREHLYSENLMLRNKIKQLGQSNTKTKTQLLKSQKQMMNLSLKRKSKQNFSSLTKPQLSRDGKDSEVSAFKWKVDNPQEEGYPKQYLEMKKNIRRLKEDIDRLHAENGELKKSIKYTRMTQLQTQNMQLQEELARMKKITNNSLLMYDELQKIYNKQKDELGNKLRREVETRAQLNRELKKVKLQLDQVNKKIKLNRSNKKLLEEINYLKRQNNQLKDVLEINIKNNSQLRQTLQSYIKNTQRRQTETNSQYVTKLDYSASVIGGYPDSISKINESPTKTAYNNGLTSLELLTPKGSLQDYRSPQKTSNYKMAQKINQDPKNEEQQQSRPLVTLQNGLKQKIEDIMVVQNQLQELEQIPVTEKYDLAEFEDMQQQDKGDK